MAICCGVGIALLSNRRLPSEASMPTESMYKSLTSDSSSGAALSKRSLRIAAVVSDRFVERREQPLVSRRKHDQMPARLELSRGPFELSAVVFDVLEHIHVEDRVEPIVLAQIRQGADRDAAAVRQFPSYRGGVELIGERGIRLEADPAIEPADGIARASCFHSPLRLRAPRGRGMV